MSYQPKYFCVGDIHGRYKKLSKLLEVILPKMSEDDKIVFLGDYVDRGKDSRKVITRVKELVDEGKAIAIKGNHDDMMYQVVAHPHSNESIYWKEFYFKPTKNSYYSVKGFDYTLLSQHALWLNELPLIHKTKTFCFLHSGTEVDPLWGRPRDTDLPDKDGRYIIHGHTPLDKPFIGENRANLDTGAAWKGGALTCGVWEEGNRTHLEIFYVR